MSAPHSPDLRDLLCVPEFEAAAQQVLDPLAWDYYRSGSWGEWTLRANREAWERLPLWHRVMVDVSRRDLSVELLGQRLPWPLLLAPTALHRMAHAEGELATVRAAGRHGCPMILSSFSSTSVEEVCAAAAASGGAPVWMQLYISPDRGFSRALAARAIAAGCAALVVTVDTPVWGTRERDVHNRWNLPQGIEVVNLLRPDRPGPRGHEGAGIGEALGWAIDASLTWGDLEALVAKSSVPVLVKGVCRPDDAIKAVEHGARGIIVSNHGGRQLDGAPPTATSLPHVAEAIAGRVPVIVDGGVRRGADILRALALGANAVAVGRPILWGLAAGGEAGVARVLEILRSEFDLAMALAGCREVADVGGWLLKGSHER